MTIKITVLAVIFVFEAKISRPSIGTHPLAPVSLRLGHAAGLTIPRTVIQYRVAASLPVNREGELERADFVV